VEAVGFANCKLADSAGRAEFALRAKPSCTGSRATLAVFVDLVAVATGLGAR
jgi:hypothetical protein